MGKRGPPKKPTTLKLLQGVPGGEHKLVEGEPTPAKVFCPEAPEWLEPGAAAIWDEMSEKLSRLGILTEIDLNALARYCDIFDRWLQTKAFLDKHGTAFPVYHYQTPQEVKDGKKPLLKAMRTFPQTVLYRSLTAELSRLESQFGLTPAARAGISVHPNMPGKQDDTRSKLYGSK